MTPQSYGQGTSVGHPDRVRRGSQYRDPRLQSGLLPAAPPAKALAALGGRRACLLSVNLIAQNGYVPKR